MTWIVLPFPPSSNRYWRHWRGQMRVSTEARQYRDQVAWILISKDVQPLAGDVFVHIKVYRPEKRRDLDNCSKVILDAMQGHAYVNDKQIKRLLLELFEDKRRPRVEVLVEPIVSG